MRDLREIIEDYRDFLEDVSNEASRLSAIYSEHLVCRRGCSECCTDLSLLPLEWFALKKEVRDDFTPAQKEGACSLLRDDACSFYKYRPLICRSHGLPLLYLMEEYDLRGQRIYSEEPEWQISWCDLNFTSVTEDDWEDIFEPEDVLNMEEWNVRLNALNSEFMELPAGEAFKGQRRFPLADIFKKD